MKRNIILLIDADADLAGALFEVTGQTGHGVRLARTSNQAFSVLNDDMEHVDLVIVDADPAVPGSKLLEGIRGYGKRAPLIVVSPAAEETPPRERYRAAAYLGKPVSVDQLRSAVDRFSRSSARDKVM